MPAYIELQLPDPSFDAHRDWLEFVLSAEYLDVQALAASDVLQVLAYIAPLLYYTDLASHRPLQGFA